MHTDEQDSDELFTNVGGDWVLFDTREPAGDAVAFWVMEEEWRKGGGDEREPTLSWQLKQRHTPSAAPVTVDSWSAKSSELECGPALAQALTELLAFVPEPARLILLVARSPLPEHRNPDSTQTFYLVNSAWLSAHPEGQKAPETGSPANLPIIAGMPGSAFGGPSPISVQMKPASTPAPGITGDIGGTGLANLMTSVSDAFANLMTMCQNVLSFAADLNARSTQQIAISLQRHPDAQAEQARLDHEYRMKQLETETQGKQEQLKEVGGVARDLGGKLLDNPALAAPMLAFAKRHGVTAEDVRNLLKGED